MPEKQPHKPSVNTEALTRLFKGQADLTRRLYAQRRALRSAPAEVFTSFEAEELYKQFMRELHVLEQMAERLEAATGHALPPLELFYVV